MYIITQVVYDTDSQRVLFRVPSYDGSGDVVIVELGTDLAPEVAAKVIPPPSPWD